MKHMTESKVISEVVQKLAAEGIEAVMVKRPDEDEEDGDLIDVLSVPAWELADGQLCRKAFYGFIHAKLASRPTKGLVASVPGVNYCDVYGYSPVAVDDGRVLDCWDLNVLSTDSGVEGFSWQEMVEADDSAWWEGWDVPTELQHLPRRVANLYMLMNYEIVDLPPVQPLSEQELIEALKSGKHRDGLFCHGTDLNDRWTLRLSERESLVLHKLSDGSFTPIDQTHIDSKGRLVLDGQVLMHRCWDF
ncbi:MULTISPECIES: hypothetical protein [Pseudomonas]|uniref:hypothetical protein n=1 Tax=Pseudomonas TaxID=286 RepID=UPI000B24483A|nr:MULTISPECIES: hypothetical protein [Pseudomonas]WHS57623.1 hypothetical protein QLH64_30180 [Pseudomonas brassicacearum]